MATAKSGRGICGLLLEFNTVNDPECTKLGAIAYWCRRSHPEFANEPLKYQTSTITGKVVGWIGYAFKDTKNPSGLKLRTNKGDSYSFGITEGPAVVMGQKQELKYDWIIGMDYDQKNMTYVNFKLVSTGEMSSARCKKSPERCVGKMKLFAKKWD